MKKTRKLRLKQPKDIAPSTPKTTHAKAISVPKQTHPGRNLGKYLHKSKLPAGGKIGTAGVKMKPRKSNKLKGY
jgi:hypothetical protein